MSTQRNTCASYRLAYRRTCRLLTSPLPNGRWSSFSLRIQWDGMYSSATTGSMQSFNPSFGQHAASSPRKHSFSRRLPQQGAITQHDRPRRSRGKSQFNRRPPLGSALSHPSLGCLQEIQSHLQTMYQHDCGDRLPPNHYLLLRTCPTSQLET